MYENRILMLFGIRFSELWGNERARAIEGELFGAVSEIPSRPCLIRNLCSRYLNFLVTSQSRVICVSFSIVCVVVFLCFW